MELKEFITRVLTEIVDGVIDAQTEATKKGAIISPWIKGTGVAAMRGSDDRHVIPVDFQIALTESKGSEGRVGLGVLFPGVKIGANGKADASEASVNSVHFMIPIALPYQK